ncbi:hypothetical protein Micbo1qcDRAFT_182060 [Microdochium bolleyi]|uniref:RRM domain-containing protein n=1 Tax=Microdochium bolleyi TaxID=196109 RepID=A0A136JDI3_9PEZI|nr:hypothetical protein Micbo1qcDRAFT_182060 [Microdochium bolleyi]
MCARQSSAGLGCDLSSLLPALPAPAPRTSSSPSSPSPMSRFPSSPPPNPSSSASLPSTASEYETSGDGGAFPKARKPPSLSAGTTKRGRAPQSPQPLCSAVYVRNLEERVKPETLKEALTVVFSDYGNIIDIVAKTNLKAKGQAFVVFDNAESAAKAVDEVQGFELFDKPMIVALARTRSDATVLSTGDKDEFEQHQRRRLAEKDPNSRPSKSTARGAGLKSTAPQANTVVPDEYLPPNKILFVQNLPDDYEIESLTAIFSRFEGFREVRMVPGRKGIAFVEYEAEAGAITAKENTAGMALADGAKLMKVTYQRQ